MLSKESPYTYSSLDAASTIGTPAVAVEPGAGDVLFVTHLIVELAVVDRQGFTSFNVASRPDRVLVGTRISLLRVGIARMVLETVKAQVFNIVRAVYEVMIRVQQDKAVVTNLLNIGLLNKALLLRVVLGN